MRKLLSYVLSFLHTFCDHPGNEVVVDLNQAGGPLPIKWCRICGAVNRSPIGWESARSPWIRWRIAALRSSGQ